MLKASLDRARRPGSDIAFEDDEMVERDGGGIAEASGERCRSWPSRWRVYGRRRDRERQLLTRQAYAEIGGVGGALARHAEATVRGRRAASGSRSSARSSATSHGGRDPGGRGSDEMLSVFE